MDDALYEKLKHALMEAENLKHEAYEETRRRQMAERELAEASRMVMTKLHHLLSKFMLITICTYVADGRPCVCICICV